MAVIALNNVYKSYGGFDILKDVSFEVHENEKVAIIGKNGTGKTTIFNIIVGCLDYDSGQVYLDKDKKIGYLKQLNKNIGSKTSEQIIKEAFSDIKEIESEMKDLHDLMSKNPDNSDYIKRYGELNEKFEFLEGYRQDEFYNKITKGLGIPDHVLSNQAKNLSGGEMTLIMLAKVLLSNPDILLLDEPTNHLDMRACEWLEQFIKEYKGSVIYISHDRYFIDNTATKVIYLTQGTTKEYKGNYSAFILTKEHDDERNLALYERQIREMQRLRETALKMRNYGTELAIKKAKNLERRIERLDIHDKPVTEKELRLSFIEQEKAAREMFYAKDIEKRFDDEILFSDVSFIMRSGDRVALIGPNGAGKSTLIKILLGIDNDYSGMVKRPGSVKYAYLEQQITFENESMSVVDIVCENLDMTLQSARNLLGKFLFSSDDVYKKISDLSGGERSRLRLLMEMQKGVNLLVLDEPTNHLDIPAREEIEQALSMFGGSIIFISHDRHFINKFGKRIFELTDKSLIVYEGDYDYYMTKKQFSQVRPEDESVVKKPFDDKKEKRKNNLKIRMTENKITDLEKQLESLDNEMSLYVSDYEKLIELEKTKESINTKIDELYDILFEQDNLL